METSQPRITIEQWRALVAVVDAGGYSQAAARLNKSQSAVTYAVQRLESLLGVEVFEIKGRKAVLTPTGQLLYRRARLLIEDARGIEQVATLVSAGWEAEIRIAAEILFPYRVLMESFERFGAESPHTRIELHESVIAGTTALLVNGQVDLSISAHVPAGLVADHLARMRVIPAAHPEHPLHKLGRPLTTRDLAAHRQIVVRETDAARPTRLMIDASQRITVSHVTTSVLAATMGLGYGWYSDERIREELAAGTLKRLVLREGGERHAELMLIYADRENAGPGTLRLAQLIREATAQACSAESREAARSASPPRKNAAMRPAASAARSSRPPRPPGAGKH